MEPASIRTNSKRTHKLQCAPLKTIKQGGCGMKRIGSIGLLTAGIAVQLFTAGCNGGIGGLFGLFGGAETSEVLSSAFTSGGSGGSSGGDGGSGGGGSGGSVDLGGGSGGSGAGGGSTNGGSSSGSSGGTGGSSDSGGGVTPGVATVHHPEPASLALFGSGLLSMGCLRRRKSRQQS